MKVSELSAPELGSLLRRGDFVLQLPPFVVRIRSDAPVVARDIATVYGDFESTSIDAFADFHVQVLLEPWFLHRFEPTVRFFFDGQPSFTPLPAHQGFAMLEWGLNWCVAAHCHQYLVIHAAVIERNGLAAILPAPPGSGKSTLCAGLVNRGWRLLSDELALYDMRNSIIYGMARPVNLKNASIDVIRAFAPDAVISEAVSDTAKGTVALMRPPTESVARVLEPATPRWVVLPKFVANCSPQLGPCPKSEAFMLVAEQSFNYDIHGRSGFDAVKALIDRCRCYRFRYSDLSDAEGIFAELLEEQDKGTDEAS